MEETIDTNQSQRPRVLFFGMQGRFSSLVLASLLAQNVEVYAVIVLVNPLPGKSPRAIQPHEISGKRRALPLVHTHEHLSIVEIAQKRQIPVWDVYQLTATETIEILAAYQPDLICVACFSRRIPRVILDLPRLGCVNVHPSLLPENRGPEPLFWVFREGHTTTGVTIHLMQERLDSGDILAQEAIVVQQGMRYAQLEQQCAEKGGELLARTVWKLFANLHTSHPQDEAQSSYHPFPNDEDFVVYPQDWDVQHLYNFIRGISGWQRPVEVWVNGIRYFVVDAVSYGRSMDEHHKGVNLPGSNELDVVCRDGWVRVIGAYEMSLKQS